MHWNPFKEATYDEDEFNPDKVKLVLNYALTAQETEDGVPVLFFSIFVKGIPMKVGSIDLRLAMNEDMYYFGQVGYNINRFYRGHHYAYLACLKLFKIAKEECGLSELIITCSPDNIASYKTLKRLGGTLLETVPVPETHDLYKRGEKVKCIFRYTL